ncbi:MAG: hypothetical protein IJR39_02270, partial [Treponema sp.]|nr:hypothetical protein [Treponema sp.]
MAGKIENNRPVDPNAKDIQIQTKLIALIGAVIVFSSVAVAAISLTVFDRKQVKATEDQLVHSADGALRIMDDWIVTLKGYAATTADRSDVRDAIIDNDLDALQTIINYYTGELDYTFMAFTDSKGKVILASDRGPAKGKQLNDNFAINRAITGNPGHAFETLGDAQFCAAYAYPIKKDAQVIGTVVFAYDLAEGDFVELMTTAYDVECTIFKGDLRIDSSLEGVTGTTLGNPVISEKVLDQGQTY